MATPKDRREVIKSYFPVRLLENDVYFNTIIMPVVDQMGTIGDLTELFVDLNSISYTPKQFVDLLGDLVGWNYLSEEDSDVQREIIKRVFTIYRERGSEWSILNTLSRATDENWVGGNLHLYKGPVRNGSSSLSYPRDLIFTWDKSKWDRGHHYRDRLVYNYGIIDLEAELWSQRLKQFLEYVIPGGIRYRLTQAINPGTGDGPIDYVTEKTWVKYWELLELKQPDVYMDSGQIEHWDTFKHKIWEGRYLIRRFYEMDLIKGTTFLDSYRPLRPLLSGGIAGTPLPSLIYDFSGGDVVSDLPYYPGCGYSVIHDIRKHILGFHYSTEVLGPFFYDDKTRSWDSGHSWDGMSNHAYTGYAKYDRISPDDCTYTVGQVQDLYPDTQDGYEYPLDGGDRRYTPPVFFTMVDVVQEGRE